MGRVSNYWEIGGVVYHNEPDSPTTIIAKIQGNPNNRPSQQDAITSLRNRWDYTYGSYPNRRPTRIDVSNISWVPG